MLLIEGTFAFCLPLPVIFAASPTVYHVGTYSQGVACGLSIDTTLFSGDARRILRRGHKCIRSRFVRFAVRAAREKSAIAYPTRRCEDNAQDLKRQESLDHKRIFDRPAQITRTRKELRSNSSRTRTLVEDSRSGVQRQVGGSPKKFVLGLDTVCCSTPSSMSPQPAPYWDQVEDDLRAIGSIRQRR
jgi:hypothetical protein